MFVSFQIFYHNDVDWTCINTCPMRDCSSATEPIASSEKFLLSITHASSIFKILYVRQLVKSQVIKGPLQNLMMACKPRA